MAERRGQRQNHVGFPSLSLPPPASASSPPNPASARPAISLSGVARLVRCVSIVHSACQLSQSLVLSTPLPLKVSRNLSSSLCLFTSPFGLRPVVLSPSGITRLSFFFVPPLPLTVSMLS